MRKQAIFLAAMMFVTAIPVCHANEGEHAGISDHRLDRITSFAQKYIDENRLPSVVYAVQRRGQLVRLEAVGDIEADDIFRIYSMTKPITVVAILMLYEQGRFLLSDPVSRYLPEFESMNVYLGPGKTRPAETAITIEHLLTHTAGLTYNDRTAGGVPLIYAEAKIWSADSLASFSRDVAKLPLVSEPGERWHYSVANDVLGRLVEVVSGQPFDQFMSEQILQPLQMTDTSFVLPDSKSQRLAPIYQRAGETMELINSGEDGGYGDPDLVPYGGSGLLSTAKDYLRFMQMLLNGGELDRVRILAGKTVDLMMMDHLGDDFGDPPLGDLWISKTENRNNDLNLGFGYGYGGYVIRDVAKNAVPGSVGTYSWGGGASTYFFIDPKEQLIAVFLTQLTPSDSYPLRAQFRGLVYQAIVD